MTVCKPGTNQLAAECDALKEKSQQREQVFAFLKDRQTQWVEMNGLPDKQPEALSVVYQNTKLSKSYLEVVNLPALASNQQFQLWAIVDGNSVDMGVFNVVIDPEQPLIEVPFVANAQAFAVTIEPAGGSPAPTLEEMVVLGNMG